jgi:hypothetical protein
MTTATEFATTYSQGYRDGEKAQRERQVSLARIQIPVCFVGSPYVLESVALDGRHAAILFRENVSNIGVPLYADPVASTQGTNSLSEFEWKLQNSLECTAAWLENGCDAKEAAVELRLNIAKLRELRRGVSRG